MIIVPELAAPPEAVDRMQQSISYYRPVPPLAVAAKPRHPNIARFFGLLTFILAGYAILGRGFAYLGVPPLFIGEVTLMLGLLLFSLTRGSTNVTRLPQFPFIVLFMIWGACRTIPFIPEWGMFALRDAVVWGYALFAIVVASLLMIDPTRLPRLFWKYRSFAIVFLIVMPLFLLGKEFFGSSLIPKVPGTSVSIFAPRRGNTMVHMAVICTFLIAGFAHRKTLKIAVLSVPVMMLFATNRAGILTFCVAVGMATVLSRLNKKSVNLWGSMLIVLMIVGVVGMNATMPGGKDVIGTDRLINKIEGIIGTSGDSRNENSADWRLQWWSKILHYTAINGTYFWGGKGFGVNLATDDGFTVDAEGELRSPHSIHMNILARTGVPGGALWILLQISWGVPIFKRYSECRRAGDGRWAGVFLVLLTYWAAAMVNSAFDVDLEGPMGGIWYWVVFGIGMAALQIHRTRPEVMYQDPNWNSHNDDQRIVLSRAAWFSELAARNWQRPL